MAKQVVPRCCGRQQDSLLLDFLCSGFSGCEARKPLEAAGLMPWYLLFLYFLESFLLSSILSLVSYDLIILVRNLRYQPSKVFRSPKDLLRLMGSLSNCPCFCCSSPGFKLHLQDIISLRPLFGVRLNIDDGVGSEALWVQR